MMPEPVLRQDGRIIRLVGAGEGDRVRRDGGVLYYGVNEGREPDVTEMAVINEHRHYAELLAGVEGEFRVAGAHFTKPKMVVYNSFEFGYGVCCAKTFF